MTKFDLRNSIRMALMNLGRDHQVKLTGTVSALTEMLKTLRAEQREKGLIK